MIFEGLITGAEVGRDKIVVSHLQYADDTIFAVEGNVENAKAIKQLLCNFEILSGLSVNYDKSCVYGVNVSNESLNEMATFLGCKVGGLPFDYLGLKVGGRIKGVEAWMGTIEKVKKRINCWRVDSLSMGGRLTTIKSVLSAIPVYNLSWMRLPKTSEKLLISLCRNFLWGSKGGENKLAWIRWESICKPVKEGGLGIRDFGAFNRALLGKWVWRFLNDKNNLWKRVVKARFGELEWSRSGEKSEGRGIRRIGWWKSVVEVVEGVMEAGFGRISR